MSEEAVRTPLGPLPLGAWNSASVSGRRLVVLVPLGSLEQHGPHLPLDTDTRIATALALAAAARWSAGRSGAAASALPVSGEWEVVLGPALAFGASGEHAGFAGTLSIGTDALASLLVELARSAGPEIAALVVVNGHGGNHDALTLAVATAQREGRAMWAWGPALPPGGDYHAGRTETSVLLALAPELVDMERAAAGNIEPIHRLAAALRAGGLAAVSPNGVLGDPIGATAAEGRELLEVWTEDLLAYLAGLAGLAQEHADRQPR